MANLETFNALSEINLGYALGRAHMIGYDSATANKAMDVMWPCGFAWIGLKIRKNHKFAKLLIEFGFRWNDYAKQFEYRGHDISHAQNMDYREQFLNDMSQYLRSHGIPSYVETRID